MRSQCYFSFRSVPTRHTRECPSRPTGADTAGLPSHLGHFASARGSDRINIDISIISYCTLITQYILPSGAHGTLQASPNTFLFHIVIHVLELILRPRRQPPSNAVSVYNDCTHASGIGATGSSHVARRMTPRPRKCCKHSAVSRISPPFTFVAPLDDEPPPAEVARLKRTDIVSRLAPGPCQVRLGLPR